MNLVIVDQPLTIKSEIKIINDAALFLYEVVKKITSLAAKIIVLGFISLVMVPNFIGIPFAEAFARLRITVAKLSPHYMNKPRVVILKSPNDPLDCFALSHSMRHLYLNYQVEEHTVSNIMEIDNQLSKCSNVKALIFKAHGNAQFMEYGKVDLNEHTMRFLDFSSLPRDTPIILESCSTGNEKHGPSIARKISMFAKGHPVFAPKADITDMDFELTFKPENTLEAKWKSKCFPYMDHDQFNNSNFFGKIEALYSWKNLYTLFKLILSFGYCNGLDVTTCYKEAVLKKSKIDEKSINHLDYSKNIIWKNKENS